MSTVTKNPVTLSLSDEDFRDAVARGIEDKILHCPYRYEVVVASVEANIGDDGWSVEALVVEKEEKE